MYLTIKGLASQKVFKEVEINQSDLNENLLLFLRANNVPVASSCIAEGICKKCLDHQGNIICNYKLQEYIDLFGLTISFDYL
ncbi:hypothetical protein HBN50_06270 [Halobacteriovorax sp. GB3]|uniref:hypothetical protein n=1 Tax=Halobacteriovorax sp. GB3 TaxID=2719615 RepID=UPI00235F91BE|nr:hypothetical protein [Halobacteriovorax sp. GB3]MDD0852692.1 hypothetical protein [Halobacteriovorax sp. GB3]